MRRAARALLSLATITVISLAAARADAQGDPSAPTDDPKLLVSARAIFEGTTIDQGGDEIVVELTNKGDKPRSGSIDVALDSWSTAPPLSRARYSLAPGATSVVHVPVLSEQPVKVLVVDEAGMVRSKTVLTTGGNGNIRIVDVEEVSRIGLAIGGAALDPDYRIMNSYSSYSTTALNLSVTTARMDRTTGDPVLPAFVSGWRGVHLVLVKSDTLAHLSGAELEALETYALGGGTVAVVVTHPEDLHHPTLEALLGGDVKKTRAATVTLMPTVLALPTSAPPRWTTFPPNPADRTEVVGWAGGNLQPSAFGATATYGLGEIVLLGFDPTSSENAADTWVQLRVADLAQRAYERAGSVVFGPAVQPVRAYAYGYEDPLQEVRRQLDPNQSARWAIGVATGLLCLYALVAGPFAFWRARKKQKPLRALWALPGYSALAFFLVVGVGFISKGASSRSRRLTFVDAGAGMSRGVAHRFRGFFSGSARELSVTATTRASVLKAGAVDVGYDNDTGGVLSVDHDGGRLEELAAIPWQTVLVHERGEAALGNGISVTPSELGSSQVIVKNRTGHALRGVVIRLPDEQVRYVPRIEDGDRIDTRGLTAPPALSTWISGLKSTMKAGRTDIHSLNGHWLEEGLRLDAPEIGAGWVAAESTVPNSIDWFPDGVPVVLAAIEGGEGKSSDAGMKVDVDRMLVRVVGWGGEP